MQIEDNAYPECERCGSCCATNTLCMSEADFRRIASFVEERGIEPIDYGKTRCCFQSPDGTCMVWEARAQACRLRNCAAPCQDVLQTEPPMQAGDDLWLVDMHEAFVNGAMKSEALTWGSWSSDGQTPAFLAATRMASLSNQNIETILTRLRLEPGMRVLDVGCGSGEYCFKLGAFVDGVSFTGLDLDKGFVQFATRRASGSEGYPYEPPNPNNDYRFICGDGTHMPFDDASFDAVVSHTYLTAVPNWQESLKEMKRVCKPRGTVSSVTSMTDDFFGTGTIGLFAGWCDADALHPGLIDRVEAISARAFPEVELTAGIAPREVPAAFAKAGIRNVACLPLGHYFCLSDAALGAESYRRHVDLLCLVEKERLARLLSNPTAKAQLTDDDWARYAELIDARYSELMRAAGSNTEWNWYGNSSLLVHGTA